MKDGPGDELIKAYFADPTSPEACEAIEAWAQEDPANMQELADFAVTEYLLHLEQKRLDTSATLSTLLEMEDVAESEVVVLDGKSPLAFKPSPPRKREASFTQDALSTGSYVLKHSLTPKNIAILATAASLLLGVVLAIVLLAGGPDDTQEIAGTPEQPAVVDGPIDVRPIVVATLTAEHEAVWDRRPGEDLYAGQRFELTQGFAQITTASGAIAILEAPVTIELINSPNALRLHAGKLVGICHTESSKGFVVKTDHADITDLGTEFGVTAHVDGVEAGVFVGEIAFKAPNAPSQVITHSQTARVLVKKDRPTLIIEDKPAEGYARRLPRPALITDASINLPGFKVEVVPNGVYEDAKLFSDRDHELNGIDVDGLPNVLIGGDLVRLPADATPDRTPSVGDKLRVEIELVQPADVYLLIKTHDGIPDWVTREYERTGLQTGIDFGAVGVGPGANIDGIQDVWKRKQQASGRVLVGQNMSRMYTIIAVPISERHD